jgi:hypothetical protein
MRIAVDVKFGIENGANRSNYPLKFHLAAPPTWQSRSRTTAASVVEKSRDIVFR